MFIDKKGRLFSKISIVDIFVILIIIVGVAGAYFTLSVVNSEKLSKNSKLALNSSSPFISADVTLEIKGVRAMTRDGLCEGDEVYETEDNKFIGTITKVTSKPAQKDYIANDGTFFKATIPDKYDVEITLDVLGKNTETGFHTESEVQLLYGKEIEIKTPTVKTKPEITGIEFKNTGEQ